MHKFIAKYSIFLPGQALRGEYIWKYIYEFEKTQWLDKKELERRQWKKLIKLFDYASRYSPYYKQLFETHKIEVDNIKSRKDLLRVPQLKKEDLRDYHDNMISTPKRMRVSRKITGGSTGQAVTLIKDRRAMAYQDAAMWRSLRWFGIDIGDKQARFWGVPINPYVRLKYNFIDFFMNRKRISAFNFNDDEMKLFFDKLLLFRPKYFYGYVSMIKEFAQFCKKYNMPVSDIGLKAVVCTSEPLFPETADYLRTVWGCPVVNDYGCGELGPIAYSCPEGGLHLMSDNLYIEVVKEDGTHALAGETGEIVITELNNYSLPLIRYNLKDVAEMSGEQCACKRELPLIKKIVGRSLDVLVAMDGRKVHGEYFNYIAEEIKNEGLGLKQMQVIQEKIDVLQINIVKDKDFNEKTFKFLESKIKDRMGNDIVLEYQFVDKIKREASGKLRLVKNEIPDSI